MDHVAVPQGGTVAANIAQIVLIQVDVQMLAESTALVAEPLTQGRVRQDQRLEGLGDGRAVDLGPLHPSRELAERAVQPDGDSHSARLVDRTPHRGGVKDAAISRARSRLTWASRRIRAPLRSHSSVLPARRRVSSRIWPLTSR